MKQCIAVTGASGFIGRHVVQELLEHTEHDVLLLSRDANYCHPSPQKNTLSRVQTIPFDLADPKSLNHEALDSCAALIHLAWQGLPNYQSLHHFENELPLQYQLIKSCVERNIKKIFISGTCFEYGLVNGALHPQTLTNPSNSYGLAKDSLRKQLFLLQNSLPFHLIWGRLFYTYGSGQSPRSLISQLETAVGAGEQSFNLSSGEQIRDYLPVESVAQKIVSTLINSQFSEIVNICSGQPQSVRALVERICKENNWKIHLNFGALHQSPNEALAFWGVVS